MDGRRNGDHEPTRWPPPGRGVEERDSAFFPASILLFALVGATATTAAVVWSASPDDQLVLHAGRNLTFTGKTCHMDRIGMAKPGAGITSGCARRVRIRGREWSRLEPFSDAEIKRLLRQNSKRLDQIDLMTCGMR
ncbi:hypothetical protein E2562_024727 [Oryza meyeriana var. granulata]|uniref:Uncharacterized protein n=1 Tax=Oryza meyeriana var. granulata TaxID=110450 RepID=A0A6G1D967_9ORYZ|nr:hypothetical protein E2562_024727 [Oryza meyeriana var. granulata]